MIGDSAYFLSLLFKFINFINLKSNDKKYADAEVLIAMFWADEDKDEFILVLSLLMYNVVLALGGGSRGGGAPWQIIAPHLPFHLITAYCMRNAVNV